MITGRRGEIRLGDYKHSITFPLTPFKDDELITIERNQYSEEETNFKWNGTIEELCEAVYRYTTQRELEKALNSKEGGEKEE